MDDDGSVNGRLINLTLKDLICPSRDYEILGSSLSYVANTGRFDSDGGNRAKDDRYNGVFHDQMWRKPVRISLGDVNRGDGAQATLLFTENNQAYKFAEPAVKNGGNWDFKQEWVGAVWWPDGSPVRRINGDKERPPRQNEDYARPSSGHSSSVVATFCSGTVQKIDEGIEYEVYQRMLTIDDKEVPELSNLTP